MQIDFLEKFLSTSLINRLKIFAIHAFTWAFLLISDHLFASDWIAITASNLSDHWITKHGFERIMAFFTYPTVSTRIG